MSKNLMILDSDADGSQWLYREMIVMKQQHPKLLPYACFDLKRNEFLIGACITRKGAKKMIDQYLLNNRNWESHKVFYE